MENVVKDFGGLNILVNNGAVQFPQDDFLDITPEQFKETFDTNIFGMFFLSQRLFHTYMKMMPSLIQQV